ncbi:hypothetical protein RFI_13583 [Reticulomyxa filosa]|uniref:Uncharacterized protein n=1 Tax=Reticulomyxa filosa TaxID=46433 RepID=X6NCH3_RETFI|nr:hypothetical protein RFI_13583 [Reticulomyxa filosa]|eukprot:ETO23598.1 hypothetical protein RFI_13583 [Reticulomyxa filosa]
MQSQMQGQQDIIWGILSFFLSLFFVLKKKKKKKKNRMGRYRRILETVHRSDVCKVGGRDNRQRTCFVFIPFKTSTGMNFVVKTDDKTGIERDSSTLKTKKVRRRVLNKSLVKVKNSTTYLFCKHCAIIYTFGSIGDTAFPDWWIPSTKTNSNDCYVKVTDMNSNQLTKRAIQELYKTTKATEYEVVSAFLVQNLHTWVQHQELENSWLSTNRITPKNLNIRWMWHGNFFFFLKKKKKIRSWSKTIPEICSKVIHSNLIHNFFLIKDCLFDLIFSKKKKRDFCETTTQRMPTERVYTLRVMRSIPLVVVMLGMCYLFDDENNYAHLLYCRVICGESAQGKQDMVRPPSKPVVGNVTLEYESLVDKLVDPSIVVCCTDCQVILLFINTSLSDLHFCVWTGTSNFEEYQIPKFFFCSLACISEQQRFPSKKIFLRSILCKQKVSHFTFVLHVPFFNCGLIVEYDCEKKEKQVEKTNNSQLEKKKKSSFKSSFCDKKIQTSF